MADAGQILAPALLEVVWEAIKFELGARVVGAVVGRVVGRVAEDLAEASRLSGGAPAVAEKNALVAAGGGVQANKAAGDAWSQAVGAKLKATHEVAVPEITVKTQGNVRTRLDWVTKDASGNFGCVECECVHDS